MKSINLLIILSALLHVSMAHMYLASLTINGQSQTNCIKPKINGDYTAPVASLNNQVLETTQNMVCGAIGVSTAAPSKCPVAAGSSVSAYWAHYTNGQNDVVDSSHVGPCMVYLSRTDNGAGNVWFKIYEEGLVNNKWCTIRLKETGGRLDFKLPSNIPNGNYLLRAETIALHEADRAGGAQPYVQCAELTITGGNDAANPTPLATFPGAYKNTDAGIRYNVYAGGTLPAYTVPGPAVYADSTPSTGTPSTSGTPSPSPSTSGTPSPSPSTSSPSPSPSTPTYAPSPSTTSSNTPSSTTGSANCTAGLEKCSCIQGKCVAGLTCLSNTCVDASLIVTSGGSVVSISMIYSAIMGFVLYAMFA